MFSRMMQTVNKTDNCYPTPQEQKAYLDYAKSLPRRFAASRAVEDHEVKLVDAVLESLTNSQPNIGDFTEAGWVSAADDVRHAVRSLVTGMLMDDGNYADAVSHKHIRDLFSNLDFPANAAEDLFRALKTAIDDTLPPDVSETLAEYLESAVTNAKPVSA
jgi:deoxyribodipyrimidine photolyase-like uncharacterized protein